jgi:hypothetical protein
MGEDKGRRHPVIGPIIEDDLRELLKSNSHELFKLIKETAWWPL